MTTPEFTDQVQVRLVDYRGDDKSVVAAARVSVQGPDVRDWEGEAAEKSTGLIKSLLRNKHGTPFEHNSMTFFVEAPIFVFREWHRHRIGWSYNEWSARYQTKMEPKFWIPSGDRPLVKEGPPMAPRFEHAGGERYEQAVENMKTAYLRSWDEYQRLRSEDINVANEIARAVLPVGLYSSMYATCNARSLMSFLQLRTHRSDATFPSHPQKEIEACADLMEAEFARLFPITHAAFDEFGRVAP